MFLIVVGAVWLYLLWVNGALSPAAWGRWLGLVEPEKGPYWAEMMDRRKNTGKTRYRPNDDDFGEGGDF